MALTKDQLIEEISAMSVLEMAELVKALEEKFGVSAAAPVAVAGAAVTGVPQFPQKVFPSSSPARR